MKAIVLASGETACVGIDALLRNGFEIAAVFTYKEETQANPFHPVAEAAAAHGISVLATKDINHPFWAARMRRLCPDVLLSFSWPQIIERAILHVPPQGCFNLHASLLPRFRGRSPLNQVLLSGETQTGLTLHRMTSRPNDGDIAGQKVVAIDQNDDFGTLRDKVVDAAGVLLDEVLPQIISGDLQTVPQDQTQATWCVCRPRDARIDWSRAAVQIRNIVRAFARPSTGASSHFRGRNCIFWKVSHLPYCRPGTSPGAVISTEPLTVACGRDALVVEVAQPYGGVCMSGEQLCAELNIAAGGSFGPAPAGAPPRKKHVLILGANGFIGSALVKRLLHSGKYEVHGIDLSSDRLKNLTAAAGFHFQEGDLTIHREWTDYHVSRCDVVVPLAASPAPTDCAPNPIGLFELEFEENLRIIRSCVKYRKRLVFPSAPELCGCEEPPGEDCDTNAEPVRVERSLYTFCKQLLDQLISAYGREEGLQYTLFRPFDWIGPGLDRIASIGSSCIVPQMILGLIDGTPLVLADGGRRKRSFTDVADGVECLYRIIENRGRACDGRIINIGNPENEISMRALAGMILTAFQQHPLRRHFPAFAGIREVDGRSSCGGDCPDLRRQMPGTGNARRLLDWTPAVSLEQSLRQTLDFFLRKSLRSRQPVLAVDKPASLYDIVSVAFP